MNLRHELNLLFIKNMTERPNDWEVDQFNLKDTLTGQRWWIASGGAFFGMYEPIHIKDMKSLWFLNKTHRKAWFIAKKKAKQLRADWEAMQWMQMEREADKKIRDWHQQQLDRANDEQLDIAIRAGAPLLEALIKGGPKNEKTRKKR